MTDTLSTPPPAGRTQAIPRVLRTTDHAHGGQLSEERTIERLVLALVLLVPLDVGWLVWAAPGAAGDFNRRVTMAPFDLALGAVLVLWASTRVRTAARAGLGTGTGTDTGRFRAGAGTLLAAAFTLVFTVSLLAHPSWRGIEYAVRLLAGAAVIDTVRRFGPEAIRRKCACLAGAAAVESVLAIAQSVHGRGFALYPLDHDGPLFAFGDTHAGRGGLSHPYHLTVFLLLALFATVVGGRTARGAELRVWAAAALTIGAGLAVTFSRAMLLAIVPVFVLWCAARRDRIGRGARVLVIAAAAGLACTTVVFASGWQERAQQSTGAGADRGRDALARYGLGVAKDHPVTGVGPARYVLALAEIPTRTVELLPPHNLVVQAAAELGVVGGGLVALIGLWFAVRLARRRSALVLGGAWLLVPFLLLDAYPYVFPTGLALSALWIGLVENPNVRKAAP